jgi:hypothetical protein
MRPSKQFLSPFLFILTKDSFFSSHRRHFPISFEIIRMGRNSCTEAGTCRFMIMQTGCLHEDDSCPSCKKTLKFSAGYLSHHSELWKGACFRKYPPADGSYLPRNRFLDEERGRPKRIRKKTAHFVAKPSTGMMESQRSGKSSDHPILQKIRNDVTNTSIDRAIAERYVRIDNQDADKENPQKQQQIVTLPNGGNSKSSRSKQRQTLGAIINGMTKALAKDKATPTRYRAEGIENAIKRARVLPTKKQPTSESGKL